MAVLLLISALVLGACVAAVPRPPGLNPEANGLVQSLTYAEVFRPDPEPATEPTVMGSQTDAPDLAMQLAMGRALYVTNCAACHRANGEGNLQRFPALNQNALVTAQSPEPLMRIVLYGRGVMPSFNNHLTPKEIAAILTYIRSAWDNDAPPIMPTQIHELQQMAESARSPMPRTE